MNNVDNEQRLLQSETGEERPAELDIVIAALQDADGKLIPEFVAELPPEGKAAIVRWGPWSQATVDQAIASARPGGGPSRAGITLWKRLWAFCERSAWEAVDADGMDATMDACWRQMQENPVGPLRIGHWTIGAIDGLNGPSAELKPCHISPYEARLLTEHWAREFAEAECISGVRSTIGRYDSRMRYHAFFRLDYLVDAGLITVEDVKAAIAKHIQIMDSQGPIADLGQEPLDQELAEAPDMDPQTEGDATAD